MLITAIVLSLVALTVLALVVSRAGAARHQEELNSHEQVKPDPKLDRPADAGAEATGVASAGEPAIERSSRDASGTEHDDTRG